MGNSISKYAGKQKQAHEKRANRLSARGNNIWPVNLPIKKRMPEFKLSAVRVINKINISAARINPYSGRPEMFCDFYSVNRLSPVRFRSRLNKNAWFLRRHNALTIKLQHRLKTELQKIRKPVDFPFNYYSNLPKAAGCIESSNDIISTYSAAISDTFSRENPFPDQLPYLMSWPERVSDFLSEIKNLKAGSTNNTTIMKQEDSGV